MYGPEISSQHARYCLNGIFEKLRGSGLPLRVTRAHLGTHRARELSRGGVRDARQVRCCELAAHPRAFVVERFFGSGVFSCRRTISAIQSGA
jgi:hypothetical protein